MNRANKIKEQLAVELNHLRRQMAELGKLKTEREGTEEELKSSKIELQKHRFALEQKDITLKELLKQIQLEKDRMKNDISANITEVLLPILDRLRIKKASRKYIDLLQHHLGELSSSFGRNIAEKSIKLSPRETEICHIIRGGFTSKEISNLLNVSCQTIEKHRKNIRHKLGITNKGVNLSAHLHKL
ncbi:MAG: LuxR C-terminal-related transcriptional regulator [Candidatus Omnitrophota bacterium]